MVRGAHEDKNTGVKDLHRQHGSVIQAMKPREQSRGGEATQIGDKRRTSKPAGRKLLFLVELVLCGTVEANTVFLDR